MYVIKVEINCAEYTYVIARVDSKELAESLVEIMAQTGDLPYEDFEIVQESN